MVNSALSVIEGKISNLYSVIERHTDRCLIAIIIGSQLKDWAGALKVDEPTTTEYSETPPTEVVGFPFLL